MNFKNTNENRKTVNLHEGHRNRIRKRLAQTEFVDADDYQTLEYILTLVIKRRDTNELAHTLINTFGSLAGVLDASIENLEGIAGISPTIAFFLHSMPFIYRNYKLSKISPKMVISTPIDAVNCIGKSFSHLNREEFYMICLDNSNKVINHKMIAAGSINQVSAEIADCVQFALKSKARKVVLLHNHPSGDAYPSLQDEETTRNFLFSFESSGIELYDHVIVNYKDDYYSFAIDGKLKEYKESYNMILSSFKTIK